MTIDTIKKRLAQVAGDHETTVNKKGDYIRLIYLVNRCLMAGYVALNADIDFAIKGTYTIPEGVTSIKSYALAECNSLESVVIPANVSIIHNFAFNNCMALRRIEFVNPIKGCIKDDNMQPQPGVTLLGLSVFKGCNSIQEFIANDFDTFVN